MDVKPKRKYVEELEDTATSDDTELDTDLTPSDDDDEEQNHRADEIAVDRVVDAVAALDVVPERVVVLGEIIGLIGPIFHDEIKCEKCGKVCKKRGFKRHRFYCANDVANDADDENN